ncbi:MAG TPA: Ig-like domain-containing protein, partial [Thermoguttaceae bacterium]|nr:Ig-like domain-containing protein [Thermoguttaceae bacterium]
MRRILNRFRRPNLIHDPACNQPPCTRANRGLYRRSLRLEWLEDRSLLSVAPTGVDLLAISDSGILDNDNLTNLDNSTAANALQFEVFGTVAGATVTLYADGMAIGSATAAGDTTPVTTTGAFDLADGAHSITARLTETASPESPDSPALGVVIDTAGPSATTDHIAKLVAADGSPDDHFGSSGVSISGNRALVGAYGDDDRGLRSGSAYVFATAPSGWVQLTKLTASDGTSDDYFGFSVAIDGSIAVVGAHADNNFSGAAYVFEETGSGWVQVAKLTANDGAASDYFGYSVSVSGNLAIVGAHGDDDLGSNSGSAYVFEDAGSGWTQIQKLTAADASAGDNFGRSISIDGQRAVIGGASSAYVFQDTGSSWTQVAKLTASDALAGDGFGQSVSLDGATAIVGAYGDDDKGYASGSAYVFKDAGSGWTQIQKLTAADGSAGDYFGLSVSVSGSTIIVGSPDDDDGGSSAGSAYVFQNTGSSWTQIAKRTANDGAASDCFGCSVSTDGATVLVGASGVAALAGSAYLFAAAGPVIQDTGVSAADQITADATPAVAFAFREAIYGQDSDVTVLDPSASPITPDAITGWGTQILTITFSTPLVSDGQYTVQLSGTITDAADNAIGSGAGYTMTFTLDTTAPPSPTTVPRLLASSDSGISQHDKVTNDATPTLQGFGIPYFRVYCDGVLASGNYESVTATLPTQPDGVHAYTVTAVDAAGNESPPCGTLMLTIDTVAPDAPAPPDLQAASDTGVSDADNLTNPTTLTFDVVAAPYFRFYRGWTRLGGDYETGTTCTVSGQPEGAQSYTVCAVDAAGNESAASSSLSVVIDTTMPFQQSAQIAKLLAADGAAGDNFGCSVSISGNLAIVGADGDDDKGSGSGSAYVFKDAGSGWTQVAKLTASDGAQSDAFGMRVSISGNLALVGAFRDDDKGSNSGSAYVFKDTGSGWTQVAKLTAADGAADDCFGWSVALDGATAIVGAYADDDLGSNSGSAYVFKDAGSGWTQVAKLTASDGADYDYFGTSVSINGSAAVVGADGNSGSAYVFEDAASGWTQAAKLTADDGPGSNYFGYSVSISGNVAVIGACGSGSAYVFTDTGSAWTEAARLTAAEGADEDFFGQSVSVSGPTIAVGAYRDDDKGSDSGSVHVFLYTGSGWAQIARHTASDGAAGDYLGWSVSTNGATTIAGAYGDDDKGNSAGSAYLSSVPPWMDLRAASDTGASNTDNVTSDATPTFDVNVSGNYFRIYCDGVQVTGDYESGTTYAPPALPDGAYVYTIVIVDAAGNALFADPLTLTV